LELARIGATPDLRALTPYLTPERMIQR